MSEQLLRLDHITMQFGGVVAVDDLELEVNEGEIVALIGPNGAGKTTAFNVITGVYQPTNGAVWFDGAKIIENHPQGKMKKQYKGQCDGLYTETLSPTPDKITRAGMARTFQNIRLWKTQTVFDNVLIAKHCRSTSSVFSAAFRLNRKEEAAQRAQVEELFGRVIPSASAIMHMLFAVVIEVQPPQMPHECSIRPLYSSMSIRPLAAVPTLSCAWMCRTSLPLWIPSGM